MRSLFFVVLSLVSLSTKAGTSNDVEGQTLYGLIGVLLVLILLVPPAIKRLRQLWVSYIIPGAMQLWKRFLNRFDQWKAYVYYAVLN